MICNVELRKHEYDIVGGSEGKKSNKKYTFIEFIETCLLFKFRQEIFNLISIRIEYLQYQMSYFDYT